MKALKHRSICCLLLALSLPASSAGFKKLSVAQLQELLTGLHTANKSDERVSSELRSVELTEELTSATMHSMANLIPGPLSTEQMYVLEARSSMLAPPPTDVPADAPPDTATQQALLAKAYDYAAKTYAQLPPITANRMTARFQDDVQSIQSFAGANIKTVNDQDPVSGEARLAIRLMNTHEESVEIKNGVSQPITKEKIAWGNNGLVASTLPPMPLPELLQQIASNGNPTWLRWELVQGKQAAVFSFTIDKKKSRYALDYCCFPDTSSVGNVLYSGSTSHPVNNGNLSTVSEWKPFAIKSGYHGELFLDPATGTVLRTIVQAEFKPSAFVHNEQIRVDYATLPVAGQPLTLPVRTFTLAEIVPNADSFAAHYAVRQDLVTEDFKDFQPAPSK
jgi:hypothetical protein